MPGPRRSHRAGDTATTRSEDRPHPEVDDRLFARSRRPKAVGASRQAESRRGTYGTCSIGLRRDNGRPPKRGPAGASRGADLLRCCRRHSNIFSPNAIVEVVLHIARSLAHSVDLLTRVSSDLSHRRLSQPYDDRSMPDSRPLERDRGSFDRAGVIFVQHDPHDGQILNRETRGIEERDHFI
jgi:hypothetical protein